jgi:diguanylate cyclase (GGDEF)-like protein
MIRTRMSQSALRTGLRQWKLWSLSAPLITALLAVESCAALLVVGGLLLPPVGVDTDAALRTTALLVVVAALHTELGRGAERVRRSTLAGDMHVNMASVWFFAAAALLTPGWAGLCAVVVHAHLWWRAVGPRVPPHRQAYTTAVFVLATAAASAVMGWLRAGVPAGAGALVLAAGLLVFFTVNTALVAGAMAVAGPPSGAAQAVGTADENLLEIATLCVGALVAAVMVVNPWLVLLSVPPLLVLQRAVLVRHLERVASIDAKTGLLNSAAWHARAERAVTRLGRGPGSAAVLVLDLDHFKAVNDTYGHLAGDEVLAAVADALRAEVRDGDLVGRFGGEEFVILLAARSGRAEADALAATRIVADRIRRRVASLTVGLETPDGPLTVAGLSVSVGAAVRPDGHGDLRTLVHAADTALYAAKRAGRNRVGIGAVPAADTPIDSGTAGVEQAGSPRAPSGLSAPSVLVSTPPPLPPPS